MPSAQEALSQYQCVFPPFCLTRTQVTQALIAALQRNPSPTRTGVQKSLVASDFSSTGASGTTRFLASGDRNAAVILVRIQPGTLSGTGYDFVPLRP